MISTQQKSNRVNLFCDSGMELIWFLEDAYEQKDVNKFFSLVSSDFKKDFIELKEQLEKVRLEYDLVELYIHFLHKSNNTEEGVSSYDICWIKRFRKYKDYCLYREMGKAKIMLKTDGDRKHPRFLLYDIYGDNPFN